MKHPLYRTMRRGALFLVACTGMASTWAQVDDIELRIQRLAPAQQRQLQVLMSTRKDASDARLFTDAEVRSARLAVQSTDAPLPRSEVTKLSSQVKRVFGPQAGLTDRIVSIDPVFVPHKDSDDGLAKTCHDPSTQPRRYIASDFLRKHPKVMDAVGGLYLLRKGAPTQLIGTVFVHQNRIVTNEHVILNATDPTSVIDVRKLMPARQLEAVFGIGEGRRITLPASSEWRRHPTLDLITTAWPAGIAPPPGLTLATDPVAKDTEVALLGFPSVNDNTDRSKDVEQVFGDCAQGVARKPAMVISMGRIASVSGEAIEHDANTMGNSSGSPVLRISDGALIAVHRGDSVSSLRNSAIAASALTVLTVASAK